MATAAQLITAKEDAATADPVVSELIAGEIVELNQPTPCHGRVCGNIYVHLRTFLSQHRLVHAATNDAGIVTRRARDTVRGGDVWFVSDEKVGKGPLPNRYHEVAPEVNFDVKSRSDRPAYILKKNAEYLDAGVPVVGVLDLDTRVGHPPLRRPARTVALPRQRLHLPRTTSRLSCSGGPAL